MHTSNYNICNGGIHEDGECTAQYSQWLNGHRKLSDREHDEIKNTRLSTVYH